MPINLSIGGKKATPADTQAAIDLAEMEYQQQTKIEDVGDSEALLENAVNPVDQNVLGLEDGGSLPGTGPAAVRAGVGVVEGKGERAIATRAASAAGDRYGTNFAHTEQVKGQYTQQQAEDVRASQEFQTDLQDPTLTDQQVGEKWKDKINQKSDKRFKFVGAGPALVGYRNYSSAVDAKVQDLAMNFTNSRYRNQFNQKMADVMNVEGYKFTPDTTAEYLNGYITKAAEAKEAGIPRAFSDILMASHLLAAKKAYTAETDLERQALAGNLEFDEDSEASISSRTDRAAGKMINDAMGIESTPESDVFAGALARKVVGDALSVNELGAVNEIVDADGKHVKYTGGLIEGMKRAVPATKGNPFAKEYNAQQITKRGIEAMKQMQGIVELILPGSKKVPRNAVKATSSNITKARRSKGKNTGNWKQMNDYIDKLENTPASFDVDLDNPLSTGNFMFINKENPVFLKIGKFDLAEDGTVKREQVKYYRNKDGTYMYTKEGDKVPYLDKRGNEVMERHVANSTRTLALKNDYEWLVGNGKKTVYFDYFVGGNNRVYVDATAGNWQNAKMPRALLQSASKIHYNLNNKAELNDLKAGIMKKLETVSGIHYDKSGVVVGVAGFDANAENWSNIMAKYEQDIDVDANATLILETANAGSGYAGISAIMEAVKLHRAIKANEAGRRDPRVSGGSVGNYYSKFLSEIDGTANGVAHSAFQGGNLDARINTATGLYGDTDLNNIRKLDALKVKAINNPESFTLTDQTNMDVLQESLQDTYVITAQGMLDAVSGGMDIDATLGDIIYKSGIINRSLGKKPMMVFGYGASDKTINKGVREAAEEWLKSSDAAATIEALHVAGINSGKFIEALGEAAVVSVSDNFDSIKLVNETMAELVNEAAHSGLVENLEIPTQARHNAILGKRETREAKYGDKERPPSITYAKGTAADKAGGEFVTLNPQETFVDPYGKVGTKFKAAKQAGVLGIHAMDAINLMKLWDNMTRKVAKKGSFTREPYANGFQVFDGIMMPPKHAREWAKNANDTFYELNAQYGLVETFAQHLEDQGVIFSADLKIKIAKVRNQRKKFLQQMKKDNFNQFLFDV